MTTLSADVGAADAMPPPKLRHAVIGCHTDEGAYGCCVYASDVMFGLAAGEDDAIILPAAALRRSYRRMIRLAAAEGSRLSPPPPPRQKPPPYATPERPPPYAPGRTARLALQKFTPPAIFLRQPPPPNTPLARQVMPTCRLAAPQALHSAAATDAAASASRHAADSRCRRHYRLPPPPLVLAAPPPVAAAAIMKLPPCRRRERTCHVEPHRHRILRRHAARDMLPPPRERCAEAAATPHCRRHTPLSPNTFAAAAYATSASPSPSPPTRRTLPRRAAASSGHYWRG